MNSRDFHSIYWWLFFLACTSLVLFGVISLTWRHSGKGNPDSDHGSAVEGRSRTQAELQADTLAKRDARCILRLRDGSDFYLGRSKGRDPWALCLTWGSGSTSDVMPSVAKHFGIDAESELPPPNMPLHASWTVAAGKASDAPLYFHDRIYEGRYLDRIFWNRPKPPGWYGKLWRKLGRFDETEEYGLVFLWLGPDRNYFWYGEDAWKAAAVVYCREEATASTRWTKYTELHRPASEAALRANRLFYAWDRGTALKRYGLADLLMTGTWEFIQSW
jgi:hypothetical protein